MGVGLQPQAIKQGTTTSPPGATMSGKLAINHAFLTPVYSIYIIIIYFLLLLSGVNPDGETPSTADTSNFKEEELPDDYDK